MKVLGKNVKNGRTWVHGIGTYEEVKSLNIEKDFGAVLNTLLKLRKTYNYIFGTKEGCKVKRNIYGQRKAG